MALASFVGTRILVSSIVSRRATPRRMAIAGTLKWLVIGLGLAAVWGYRVPVDALALATGISCLPAGILCEALLWSVSRRADGTRV